MADKSQDQMGGGDGMEFRTGLAQSPNAPQVSMDTRQVSNVEPTIMASKGTDPADKARQSAVFDNGRLV